jgi:predicted pyridoxine 5'-phosphate oxidase superfamily flavin-nucleotide-binding protein
MTAHGLPGSAGEHALQQELGTARRAAAFYDKQMLDHLNPVMREFIARQTMAFIATADAAGNADSSFRAGPPGFVRVLDERTVMYPDFRGNGVMASLGNLTENPGIGILFVDFFDATVGLHVNGRARVVEDSAVRAFETLLTRLAGGEPLRDEAAPAKLQPERWVVVEVEEAYIHCSKHIPLLARVDDEARAERDAPGGDYFAAKATPRPWNAKAMLEGPPPAPAPPAPEPERLPPPLYSPATRAAAVFSELADAG